MTEKKNPPKRMSSLSDIIRAAGRRDNRLTPELVEAIREKLDKPQGKINFPPRFRGSPSFWKTGLSE